MTRRRRPPSAAPPVRALGLGVFILSLLCLGSGRDSCAETVLYVQSLKAALYLEPRLGAAVAGEAKRGEPLPAGEKQGGWYPVRHNGRDLWASALLLAERPPIDKVSLLHRETADLAPGARKRASAFTTAAAARGLQESERQRLSGRYQARDFARLEKIEELALPPEEVMGFLRQGVQP